MKAYHRALKEEVRHPGKPIVKKGTLDIGIVETTPVVWKGRLLRFEWVRNPQWGEPTELTDPLGYYRFTDMETEESTPRFADNHSFGCALAEGDMMVVHGVFGTGGGNRIDEFRSNDLKHWESKVLFEFPEDWTVFNTSVCKGPDGYRMAIEIGAPAAICGVPFTVVFAKSGNLIDWELLPTDKCIYTRERYSACPTIRYADGFYYMIYLEGMPCHRWVPYIVRTKDFTDFELGLKNPVLFFDDNDKIVQRPGKFTAEQLEHIDGAVNCNNSDVDLCEFNGKTVILYSWGNQFGKEFLAEAEYDGGMEEFFKSFF